ncbi:DNA-binding protein [Enterococcus sp. DIV0756]|uniref:DNA-binding protein n=1 Tax=Enterococcus sp. DIV0756 TaxID=2774636 RepID=UPI003F68511B
MFPIIQESIEEYTGKLLSLRRLPLVLTNENLKEEFQVSDSTLNRLINLADFPKCWYGIRGHYSKEDIMQWYRNKNYDLYVEKMRAIRSL